MSVWPHGKAGAEAVECASIEARQPGGALLDANATPASTKGAASVKLLSVAEIAATTKPEALNVEPLGECKAWRGFETPLLPREGSGEPGMSPRGAPTEGVRRHDRLLREGKSGGERGPLLVLRQMPRACVPAARESAPIVLRGPALCGQCWMDDFCSARMPRASAIKSVTKSTGLNGEDVMAPKRVSLTTARKGANRWVRKGGERVSNFG
jgi:hypothetical protein